MNSQSVHTSRRVSLCAHKMFTGCPFRPSEGQNVYCLQSHFPSIVQWNTDQCTLNSIWRLLCHISLNDSTLSSHASHKKCSHGSHTTKRLLNPVSHKNFIHQINTCKSRANHNTSCSVTCIKSVKYRNAHIVSNTIKSVSKSH